MKQVAPFMPFAYMQGKVIPFEKANVSIATHALHYGTASFGGMRTEVDPSNKNAVILFRPNLHIERLQNSAKLLGFTFSAADIQKALTAFIAANPATSYYIRPLLYTSDLGIAPRLHDLEHDLLIYGLDMGEYLSRSGGITCTVSSWTRPEDRAMPLRGKISGTYINSALAKSEAVERGYDEAILLNSRGKVCEASAMNIFIVRDGVLITPSVTDDILEGITRRSIIEIAKESGLAVIERAVDKSELFIADEVFLCGTAARITSVNKIEQYKLPTTHPITDKLLSSLSDITKGTSKNHKDWVVSYSAKP